MESLLFIIIMVVLFRMFFTETAPPPKPKQNKCKRCKVNVGKDETLCYHCEIIEFRKWKYDQSSS